jgi:hypothetical protein
MPTLIIVCGPRIVIGFESIPELDRLVNMDEAHHKLNQDAVREVSIARAGAQVVRPKSRRRPVAVPD